MNWSEMNVDFAGMPIYPWQQQIVERIADAARRGKELRVVLHPRGGFVLVEVDPDDPS